MAVAFDERSTAAVSPGGWVKRRSPKTAGRMEGSATARLRALNSLPRRHQAYFFWVIRNLCRRHVAAILPYDSSINSGELFSEVIAKLLGVSGIGDGTRPRRQ